MRVTINQLPLGMKSVAHSLVWAGLLLGASCGALEAESRVEFGAIYGEVEESSGSSEASVHQRRLAQLRRLQYLAVKNDRRDLISRVDGLIARELRRYARVVKQEPISADRPPENGPQLSLGNPQVVSNTELEAEVKAMEERETKGEEELKREE